MLKKILIVVIALTLIPLSSVSAANYYVSTSGNNSNNGTSTSTAWKTIQYAVTNPVIQPGDTINVMPGIYTENIKWWKSLGGKSGTPSSPIILKAYEPSNKPKIVKVENGQTWLSLRDISNVVVEGLKAENYYGPGAFIYAWSQSIENVTFQNLELINQMGGSPVVPNGRISYTILEPIGFYGIAVNTQSDTYEAKWIKIQNNYLQDIQTTAGYNAAGIPLYNETMTLVGNIRYSVVQNNTFLRPHNIVINLLGITPRIAQVNNTAVWGRPSYVVVRNNTITAPVNPLKADGSYYSSANPIYTDRNQGPTLIEGNKVSQSSIGMHLSTEPYDPDPSVYHGDYIVRNNYISSRSTNYIAQGADSGYAFYAGCYPRPIRWHDNITIYHNTFVTEAPRIYGGVLALGYIRNMWIKNNVVYDTQSVNNGLLYFSGWPNPVNIGCPNLARVAPTDPSTWVSNGNLWYSPNVNAQMYWGGNRPYSGLNEFKTGSGQEANGIWAQPSLNSAGQLQPSTTGTGQAIALTKTKTQGSGTVVSVENARHFYDGWGIPGEKGDRIIIGTGGSKKEAYVTKADFTNNTLTIDRSISWGAGEEVNYYFEGARPSIGRLPDSFYNHSGNQNPTPTPSTVVPTPTPTPSTTPLNKYDVVQDGVVDILDIIDVIKYLFN